MIEETLAQALSIGMEILRFFLLMVLALGALMWVVIPILSIVFIGDVSGKDWGWKGVVAVIIIAVPTWIIITSLLVALGNTSGFTDWLIAGTSLEEDLKR